MDYHQQAAGYNHSQGQGGYADPYGHPGAGPGAGPGAYADGSQPGYGGYPGGAPGGTPGGAPGGAGDGERGLGSTLVGGAAGAFLGKKVGLGGVGGAVGVRMLRPSYTRAREVVSEY